MELNTADVNEAFSMEYLWASMDLGLDQVQLQWPESPLYRFLAVVILSIVPFTLYYIGRVANKPKVIGGRGGRELREKLLENCPILSRRYWPTFWAFNAHLTTMLRVVWQKMPRVEYRRQVLTLMDGGEVALDWGYLDKSLRSHEKVPEHTDSTPVALILPGITGHSGHNYLMHITQDCLLAGYRPVVFNQRGNGGMTLKTFRIYNASNVSDLCEVINHIIACYSKAPIVGIGVSLGGMMLTQYLHQLGKESDLKAVIAVCAAWEPFETKKNLEENLICKMVYSKFMVRNLKKIVKDNTECFTPEQLKELPVDLETVFRSTVVSEFDTSFTVPMFGYASLDDYYNASRNAGKIHKICRPLICLNASDDPFVPEDSVPVDEFKHNPHTVLIMTSHGGHFGFVEGANPSNETWMNKFIREILTAFHEL